MSKETYKIFNMDKKVFSTGCLTEVFTHQIGTEIGSELVEEVEFFLKKGTVRGLFFEDNECSKLVRCSYGKSYNVIVDIRKDSEEYGKKYYFELSQNNGKCLWIPHGYAHGFQAVDSDCIISYKCSNYYDEDLSKNINPKDEKLDIRWIRGNHIFEQKDLDGISFNDYNN
jgi:dTDP-4-dehydrorhamnose 3,5-epimerase